MSSAKNVGGGKPVWDRQSPKLGGLLHPTAYTDFLSSSEDPLEQKPVPLCFPAAAHSSETPGTADMTAK